jgi:prepilin-type N-terminal cleavage/methylation domain-containing protein
MKMNMKNNLSRKAGFTMLEVMIVIALSGLLCAVTISSWTNSRGTAQTKTCINNLRMIDAAIQQWTSENSMEPGTVVSVGNVTPYLGLSDAGSVSDTFCPADSSKTFQTSYTLVDNSTRPICNIDGNKHNLDGGAPNRTLEN